PTCASCCAPLISSRCCVPPTSLWCCGPPACAPRRAHSTSALGSCSSFGWCACARPCRLLFVQLRDEGTISFRRPRGKGRKLQQRFDRRVVREPDREAVLGHLAPLGRPLGGRLEQPQATAEDVVDCVGCGRRGQSPELEQLGEDLRPALRTKVEIAAEDQRRLAGPLGGGGGGAAQVL